MKTVFKTNQGKVRQNNEDNGGIFLNSHGVRLAIVADGMGGHLAGEVASQMTIDYLQKQWEESGSMVTATEAEAWFRKEIKEINRRLFIHSEENVECQGMGTTIVAAICTDSFSTIANVGDSRCYLNNDSGFKQVTEDHTLVNELVRTGQISKEEAEQHPRKNVIIRALGTETQVEMDLFTILFEEGDILCLCSDGLSDKVSEKDMMNIIMNEDDIEQKANSFITMANENGGEDNITLVLLQFSDESESR